MASVPGFLTKTFEIFSSPEYSDCCGWGPNGDTIIIRKIEQFSKNVLPKYFKHSNFQSFVRQLNMYDFHKTVQDPNHGEFQHQYFKQGRPDLLVHIKRKANNRTATEPKKLGSGYKHSTSSSSHNLLPDEDYAGDADYENYEAHDYYETAGSKAPMLLAGAQAAPDFERRMEGKMSKLEEENRLLKRMFIDSHNKNVYMQERMEKVLKTLYNVFVSHPQAKQLTNRLPSFLLMDNNGNGAYPAYSNGHPRLLTDDPLRDLPMTNGGDSSLDRLPSLDLGSPLFYSAQGGQELTSSTRSTSFDFAAASVSAPPPLRYLPSFDTYSCNDDATDGKGGAGEGVGVAESAALGQPLTRRHSLIGGGLGDVVSDRVTVLGEVEGQGRVEELEEEEPELPNGNMLGIANPALASLPINQSVNFSDAGDVLVHTKTGDIQPILHSSHSSHSVCDEAAGADAASTSAEIATPRWNLRVRTNKRRSSGLYSDDFIVPVNTPTGHRSGSGSSSSFYSNKKNRASADSLASDHAMNTLPMTRSLSELMQESKGEVKEEELSQVEARQFVDLLQHNQNTTLNRLDSLEQTIATLLDSMDYSDGSNSTSHPAAQVEQVPSPTASEHAETNNLQGEFAPVAAK